MIVTLPATVSGHPETLVQRELAKMPAPEIVIVSDLWFPFVNGLAKALRRTASALRRSGISVTVLTVDDGRYRGDPGDGVQMFPPENFLESATAFIANSRPRISIFSKFFLGLPTVQGKELVQVADQVALIENRCRSSYNVFRVPTIWFPEQTKPTVHAGIARAINAFVSLNQVIYDQLQGLFPDHVHLLAWNCSDVLTRGQLDARHAADSRVLLWGGRFNELKNLESLVTAWRETNGAIGDGWRLHLYGEPCDPGYLERVLALADQSPAVDYRGVYREGLASVTPAPAGIVIPSLREGCSNLLVEAFGLGIPVIGSDIPGVGEHLSAAGQIVIAPPYSSAQFADALRVFCAMEETERRAMGVRAWEYARANFVEDSFTEMILEVYEERLCMVGQPA